MQKLVIPVLLTLFAQVGFAKPEPTSSQRERASSQTPAVDAQNSASVSDGNPTDSDDDGVNCEVMLTGHGALLKAAATLHRQLANQEFNIYAGQGDPHLFSAFGLEKLSQDQFESLRMVITENPNMHGQRDRLDGDYRVQFFVGKKEFVESAIAFDLPPVFIWMTRNGSKKDFNSEMKKRGIVPAQIMQPDDLEDRMFGVHLKSRNEVKTYLTSYQDDENQIRYVEIGAYLPCNSTRLKGSMGKADHLTPSGWVCRTPLLSFVRKFEAEVAKTSGKKLLN